MTAELFLSALIAVAAQSSTTLQRIDPPAAPGAAAPAFSASRDSVALTWLEPTGAAGKSPMEGPHSLRFSRWNGKVWSTPVTIASGTDLLINWADVPGVVDLGAGRWLAHWTTKMSEDAFGMALARSEDGGTTWKRLAASGPRDLPEEQSFVSLLPEAGGVRAAWLERQGRGSVTTLRTGIIRETLSESRLLDARVCECCQISSAETSEGPLVVYRDRSDSEIRDIAVVRRSAAGWTKPSPVAPEGWKIAGCPVNGPAVAANGRSVAVVWFTAAGGTHRVEAAFSADAGAHFGPPALVDGASPLGRVGIVRDENGDAIVIWAAAEGGSPTIRLRRVSPGGSQGAPLVVAPTSVARTVGIPSLVRSGRSLLVAWIEKAQPAALRAAVIPIDSVR
ncbi:MAG TPA: sialidase family protein [Thermoanaerobaculia bacterium]